jgi:hypothetical protein
MKYFIGVTALLLVTGCSVTVPNSPLINEEYIAHSDDFEVIGDVVGTSSVTFFLIFPLSVDCGYLAAYNDALMNAGDAGAEDLINVFSDVRVTNVLFIFRTVETTVYAKAIKRKQ